MEGSAVGPSGLGMPAGAGRWEKEEAGGGRLGGEDVWDPLEIGVRWEEPTRPGCREGREAGPRGGASSRAREISAPGAGWIPFPAASRVASP